MFADALDSVRSFAFTKDEVAAPDHYIYSMSYTWLVCAKDEAVCKVLSALTIARVPLFLKHVLYYDMIRKFLELTNALHSCVTP